MASIVAKVISGNDVKNGDAVIHPAKCLDNSSKIDSYHVLSPTLSSNSTNAIATLNDKYCNYFDDPRYYSGDANT